ncbi:hypothetical protein QWY85_00115 [Neolewinella lacunae]|uniref:Uncharacterized protein n=1 Tax=Neolewinella lacunae TaxID=1517758 RepID=A0A923PQ28_9BACT|nr:hypothetical protein [Neolewinella lacunae]MBC6995328.1 hypothetical protein [Neolewinella lacunae]MDN3633040.1 hypothetical protein [Neolewinella lacunae]
MAQFLSAGRSQKLSGHLLKLRWWALLPLLLGGCGERVATQAAPQCYRLPAGTHLPDFGEGNERLFLSVLQAAKEQADTLQLFEVAPEGLQKVQDLASGTDWFINWADHPGVAFYGADEYFFHWRRYSGAGTYDYDIHYGVGALAGPSALLRGKLHGDTVRAEHGFLSAAPLPDGDLQLAWLDGRFTKLGTGAAAGAGSADKEQSEDHAHGGAMTLRARTLTDSGSVALDNRVCDCCNTATAASRDLVMVAYRDRSEHEIRDIAYVTRPTTAPGDWSTPKLVAADNWEIKGCPVNGPALGANAAGQFAIAWYTGAEDNPRIQFARYEPAAGRFGLPTVLDAANPLGRLDLRLEEDGTAYVTALCTSQQADAAQLTLFTVSSSGEVRRQILAETSAARGSGFPKLARLGEHLFWARTVLAPTKGEQYVEVCYQKQ